jgi:hypothetical protein
MMMMMMMMMMIIIIIWLVHIQSIDSVNVPKVQEEEKLSGL